MSLFKKFSEIHLNPEALINMRMLLDERSKYMPHIDTPIADERFTINFH